MHFIKRIPVVSILLFLVILIPNAWAEESDSKILLETALNPALQLSRENEKLILNYCPDNVCISFEATNSIPDLVLYDFAVIFLIYRPMFAEFRQGGVRLPNGHNPYDLLHDPAEQLLEKYSRCLGFDNSVNADAVLKRIQRDFDVHPFFIRTDEGNTAKEEIKF